VRGGASTTIPLAKNIILLKWFNFLIAFRPFAALAIIYWECRQKHAHSGATYRQTACNHAIHQRPAGQLPLRSGGLSHRTARGQNRRRQDATPGTTRPHTSLLVIYKSAAWKA